MIPANSQSASEPSKAPTRVAQTKFRFISLFPPRAPCSTLQEEAGFPLLLLSRLRRGDEIVERLVVREMEAAARPPGEAVAVGDLKAGVADEGAELFGGEELVPIVGAARDPACALADQDQHQPGPGGAVRRRQDEQPARLQRRGETVDIGADVG